MYVALSQSEMFVVYTGGSGVDRFGESHALGLGAQLDLVLDRYAPILQLDTLNRHEVQAHLAVPIRGLYVRIVACRKRRSMPCGRGVVVCWLRKGGRTDGP